MAASPVLVDSSYYIRLLRAGQDPLRSLALAAETRDLVVCGIVRCEVGRALRRPEVRTEVQGFLGRDDQRPHGQPALGGGRADALGHWTVKAGWSL